MWLTGPDSRAEIRPDQGGLIARVQVRFAESWVDLLRPEPATGSTEHGLPLFGSFPMVPFANRLPGAALPLGRGWARFDRNWPPEGIAHHGTGWGQTWSATRNGDSEITMTTVIRDADGTTLGQARQSLTLLPHGLSAELTYRHDNPQPMRAGIGHHPWFHAPDRETVAIFAAGGQFAMGPDDLAAEHLTGITEVCLGHADAGLNTCYSGWSGTARVIRPSLGLAVLIRSGTPLLQAYVATQLDAICLEPVTHHPGSALDRRWEGIGGMDWMVEGQSIVAALDITAHTASRPRRGLAGYLDRQPVGLGTGDGEGNMSR